MNLINEKLLFDRFPKLFKDLIYGIGCNDGWYDLVYNMCENIQKISDSKKIDCSIIQIKQKFGILRVYTNTNTNTNTNDNEIENIIRKFESLSKNICEICGNSGMLSFSKLKWCKTLCDVHVEELNYLKE